MLTLGSAIENSNNQQSSIGQTTPNQAKNSAMTQ